MLSSVDFYRHVPKDLTEVRVLPRARGIGGRLTMTASRSLPEAFLRLSSHPAAACILLVLILFLRLLLLLPHDPSTICALRSALYVLISYLVSPTRPTTYSRSTYLGDKLGRRDEYLCHLRHGDSLPFGNHGLCPDEPRHEHWD
jgi:hypothetical protein